MGSDRLPKGHRLLALLTIVVIALILNSVPSAAQSNSQARIVRLSFVEGTVTLQRPGVDQWAQAFINTPIQQGFKLATAANSFAEVQFENGSTARLGQLSELDFTDLSLSPQGAKINHMTLAQGYATFTVMPERGDVYAVEANGSTYTAADKTMFRIDLQQAGQRLEVFKGKVEAQSPYGNGIIAKNQELSIVPSSADRFQVTDGITQDAWDRWVDKRQQTETVAANRSGPGSSGWAGSSLYGWSDLAYYGTWNSLPGYGSCWAPSMGVGWSPYSIGRWAWYSGFGYTWISGLPWGWLPFHYGNWIDSAGSGWCWLPGNFSNWSPGLVTWYEGPGWIGWAPRTATGGGPAIQPGCRVGQNCSTAVSLNTFQRGRPISPRILLRGVDPQSGRSVSSPSVPLTRDLRLPGPVVAGSPFASARDGAVGAGMTGLAASSGASHIRMRRGLAAPTRVFATGTIRGAWDVQPHAPSAFSPAIHRFTPGQRPAQMLRTNTSNPHGTPAVNNDMLRPARTMLRGPGAHRGTVPSQLTSIPISSLGVRSGTMMHHSTNLVPLAQPARSEMRIPTFTHQRMPTFRRNGFPARNRSMENLGNARSRSQMQNNRRFGTSRENVQRAPASRPSSRGFGGGGMMNRSSGQMGGGMRGGMGGGMREGMGGGMRSSGGGGGHGPHH